MNADLTINSIVFAKSFDEKDGSERRSTARGINTADIMTILRQDAVDSATKVPMKRYTIRFDQEDVDSVSGQKFKDFVSFTFNVSALSDSTKIATLVATFRAAVASTSPNYITQLLNNES